LCSKSSSQTIHLIAIANSDRSHHDFPHLYGYHENLYLDMSHGTAKKAKLHATPSEAIVAKDKSVHVPTNFDRDIQWRHAPNSGNL
jgi:hypothetical protein